MCAYGDGDGEGINAGSRYQAAQNQPTSSIRCAAPLSRFAIPPSLFDGEQGEQGTEGMGKGGRLRSTSITAEERGSGSE